MEPQNTENNETDAGGEAQKAACTFIKPRKIRGNLRKKESDYVAAEDESNTTVVKKQKTGAGGLVTSTKDKSTEKDDLSYKSVGAKLLGDKDYLATASIETETERDRDEVAIRRRKKAMLEKEEVLAGDEAEKAEALGKVYKGANNYTDWIEKKEASGLFKGTGIKAGPIRAMNHIRISARFEYNLGICKDYKETGYCGYGDSCKFLHDRSDYKMGWELDKEWDAMQKGKKSGLNDDTNYEVKEDDGIPFACALCRQPFVNPVVTKCKHYFCERCALAYFKKDMKCSICGENTGGAFSFVDKKIKQRMDEKWKEALEQGHNLDESDTKEPEPDYMPPEEQPQSAEEQEQEKTEEDKQAEAYLATYGK